MLYVVRQWPHDVQRKGEHALSSWLQGGKVVVQDRTQTALPETRHWLNQSPFREGVTVTCKRSHFTKLLARGSHFGWNLLCSGVKPHVYRGGSRAICATYCSKKEKGVL